MDGGCFRASRVRGGFAAIWVQQFFFGGRKLVACFLRRDASLRFQYSS